ncbi:hypothetical protein [Brevundimonas diminuta]
MRGPGDEAYKCTQADEGRNFHNARRELLGRNIKRQALDGLRHVKTVQPTSKPAIGPPIRTIEMTRLHGPDLEMSLNANSTERQTTGTAASRAIRTTFCGTAALENML